MKSSCVYRLKYIKIDTVSRQKYGSIDNGTPNKLASNVWFPISYF